MKVKKKYDQLITAQEAVRIAKKACTVSDTNVALDVCREWWSDPNNYKRRNEFFVQAFMLSAVYAAGRIQGIREERLTKVSAKAGAPAHSDTDPASGHTAPA